MKNTITNLLSTLLLIAAFSFNASSQALRVTPNGSGNKSGTSWDNAAPFITNDYIGAPGQEIWVKAGVYDGAGTYNASVRGPIYGGFNGTETQRSQRDAAANVTVIQNFNTILPLGGSSQVFDGFTFVNTGLANVVNDVVNNCIFDNTWVYTTGGNVTSSFTDCTFKNQTTHGEAFENYVGGVILTGCLFKDNNYSTGFGSAFFCQNDDTPVMAALYNCTFDHNTGTAVTLNHVYNVQVANCLFINNNGTIISINADISQEYDFYNNTFTGNNANIFLANWEERVFIEFMNNIVWGNTIFAESWLQTLSHNNEKLDGAFAYNILQGSISSNNDITEANNLITDPVLNSDYTLSSCSPAINAGVYKVKINTFDSVYATGGRIVDLAGNPRIFGASPDMGCYEYQAANYISGGFHTYCSTDAPTDLYSYLHGNPDTLGVWSGPSAVTGGYHGTFNPATMAAGTYTYSLTGGVASCTSVPVVVTVVPKSNAGRDTAINTCYGNTLYLYTLLGSNVATNGTWSGPEILTDYYGVFVAIEIPGDYYFTYTVPGNSPCGSSSATVKITINKQPWPGTSNDISFVCSGSGPTNLFSYLQNFPDTVGVWSSTDNTISITGGYRGTIDPSNLHGSYLFTYTVTGVPPCFSNIASVLIEVVTSPNTGISDTITVCRNASPINLLDSLKGNPQGGGRWLGSTLTNGSLGTFNPANMIPDTYYYLIEDNSGHCGAMQSSVTVNVNPAPTIPIISANGPASFCTGGSVSLTSSVSTGNLWSTGEATQSITVTSSGDYSVSQSNSFGCVSTSAPKTVTVNTFPATPVITANGPTTFCFPKNVTLTSSSASGYLWSNGATTQSITVASTGDYSVTVSNSSGCKTSSVPTSVTVNHVVTTPLISANGPTSFCSGLNVVLTSSSLYNNTWSTGDTTNFITVASTGNYAVTVSTDSGCKAFSAATGVTVNPLPTVGTYALPSVHVCRGSDVSLNGTGAATYTWSDGIKDGIYFVPSVEGTYYVTGTTADGCSGTSSISIDIMPVPEIGYAVSPAAEICAGNFIKLNVTGTDLANAFWSDDYGDFIENGQYFAPPASEAAYVEAVGSNGCVHDTFVVITVHDLPVVGVIASPANTVCSGTSVTMNGTGADSYTWNNGVTDGQAFVPSSNTAYTVTGKNSFGCINTASESITVLPLQTINPQASKATICEGDSSNLSVDAPGNTIDWYDAQDNLLGTTSSGANFTVHPSSNSTYYAVASPTGPQTHVYHISLNDLFDMSETCNNNDYYSCDGFTGFQWQDVSAGRIASIHIDFVVGVDCDGWASEHDAYLNDNFVNSFSTNFFPQTDCSCAATGHQLISMDIPTDGYVEGSLNYFTIYSNNCFGLSKNFNLGADFAVVTVVSVNDCPSAPTPVTVDINAGQTWYLDADNDGHYVSSTQSCSSPGAGYNTTATVFGDCNDNDPTVWQSATLYIDNDGDGYDGGQTTICYGTTIPAHYTTTTLGHDCDDNNAATHATRTWYLDADNDGHYVSSVQSCSSPGTGYNTTATVLGDCNDNDPAVWQSATLYIDNDGDGYDGGQTTICYGTTIPVHYSTTTLGHDCDDNNANVHAMQTWYLDADNDGHYVSSVQSCGSPGVGYNTTATILGDCNDNDATVWQSATLYIDNDGDGYDGGQTTVCYGATIPAHYSTTTLGHDCDDNNAATHATRTWYLDADNDGHYVSSVQSCSSPGAGYNTTATVLGDCNDNDATIWRSATLYIDHDADGYDNGQTTLCYGAILPAGYSTTTLGHDCNDNNAAIHTVPAAPGSVTGPDGACKGQTVIAFSVTTVQGASSYKWTLPTGVTGTSTTNSINLSFTNSYAGGNICVQASNACGVGASSCKAIIVYTAKPVTPAAITGSQTICAGSTLVYSISPVAKATSYVWTAPSNAAIIGGQGTISVTVKFNSSFTSGTLNVAASNCVGTGSSKGLSIKTNPVPSKPGVISGIQTGVCNGMYQYSVAAVSNASSYSWSIPAGCTINGITNTNTITVNVPANFKGGSVCVAALSLCNSSSASNCISLSPAPGAPSAITGPSSVCKNKTGVVFSVTNSAGTIFNWSVPAGCTITKGQGTSTITVNWGTAKGNVTVAATNVCGVPCVAANTKAVTIATSGCGNTREDEDTTATNTDQNTIIEADGITIWPNPSNGLLFVNIELQDQASIGLMVVNTMGQVVYQQPTSLQKSNYQARLDLSRLSAGIYFIRITKGEKAFNEKIIITR